VWQPAAVFLTDEGLEGLDVHVANDTDRALTAMLDVALLRGGQTIVARGSTMCAVDARGTARYQVDALLDGFHDVSYAYQFGPPAHDVVVATLSRGPAEVVSEAFWIRDHAAVAAREAGAVIAEARPLGQGHYALTISSERFLYAAHVDVDGYLPDDNYFSLMPGATKVVRLTPLGKPADGCAGWIEALNLDGPVRIHTHRLVTS
jgi:beta-mannosidase